MAERIGVESSAIFMRALRAATCWKPPAAKGKSTAKRSHAPRTEATARGNASAFAARSPLRSRPGLRHRLDCVDDGLIAGAAAIIAGEMRADLFAARNAAAGQQFLRGQQQAGRAIAALQGVARDERLLQVGDLVRIGHPFDGVDARAVALHRQQQAAAHHHAVDAHAAGAAYAVLAADMTARERNVFAQEVDQRLARVDVFAHLLAVDGDGDVVEALAHDGARASCCATRRSRTPARWFFTAPDACTSSAGSRSSASAFTAASTSPFASAGSACRARTGVAPTPK